MGEGGEEAAFATAAATDERVEVTIFQAEVGSETVNGRLATDKDGGRHGVRAAKQVVNYSCSLFLCIYLISRQFRTKMGYEPTTARF